VSRQRRVLVALPEPGYFRLYGPTVVALGTAGWDVLLAFDRPEKRGGAQVPARAGTAVRSLGGIPDVVPGTMASLRAAVDYLRYLESPFENSDYLRRRSERTLPPSWAFLTRIGRLPRVVVGGAIRLMRVVESCVAPDAGLVQWIKSVAPDVVFLSPLVTLGPSGDRQTELVKAARAARVPIVVGVASWDHLTSKGLVRIVPDMLLVWNEAQAVEANELHRIPRARVAITGAQSFDHWFEPPQAGTQSAFRARLGISNDRRVVLFVGSSRNMAPGDSEVEFVRRWIGALRASPRPELQQAFLLVRPHPTNTEPWAGVALGPDTVVLPERYSGIPLSDDEVETFRQSLLASAAVVGINTTAMIEAAILDRPVLTVRDPAFAHSQEQTLHFGHLPTSGGGFVTVAASMAEHVEQLDDVLRNPGQVADARRRFVRRFVRPLGLETPATLSVIGALERAADAGFRSASRTESGGAADALAHHGGPAQ